MLPLSASTLTILAHICDHAGARGWWPHRHRDVVDMRTEYRHRRRLLAYGLVTVERVAMARHDGTSLPTTRVIIQPTSLGRTLIAAYRNTDPSEE